jgi:hypothetical protein
VVISTFSFFVEAGGRSHRKRGASARRRDRDDVATRAGRADRGVFGRARDARVTPGTSGVRPRHGPAVVTTL